MVLAAGGLWLIGEGLPLRPVADRVQGANIDLLEGVAITCRSYRPNMRNY